MGFPKSQSAVRKGVGGGKLEERERFVWGKFFFITFFKKNIKGGEGAGRGIALKGGEQR